MRATGLLVVAVVLAGCSSAEDEATPARERPSHEVDTTTTTTTARPPEFRGSVVPVGADRLSASWRPGCPVPPEALRLVVLDHWGYDGAVHSGELVVHADHADGVLSVFARLFEAQFPIERVQLVDAYGGDDEASTRANNTAGFNCRDVVGRPGAWSEHAFGRAIDLNPLVNPYVQPDGTILPPESVAYLDRSQPVPGLIVDGDAAVTAFAAIGWSWGGAWSSPDYQHFSASGR